MSSTDSLCLLISPWRPASLEPLRKILLEELKAIRADLREIEVDASVLKSALFLRVFSVSDESWEIDHDGFLGRVATRVMVELKCQVWQGEFNGYASPLFWRCQAVGDSSLVTKTALMKELGWGPKSLQAHADEGGFYLTGGKSLSLTFDIPRPTSEGRAENVRNAMQRRPIAPMVDAWLAAARRALELAGPSSAKTRKYSAPFSTALRLIMASDDVADLELAGADPGDQGSGNEALDHLADLTAALARWCDQLRLEIAAAASAARFETHYSLGSRLDVLIEWTEQPTDLGKGLDLFEQDNRGRAIQEGLETLESPGPRASADDRENYELNLQRLSNLLFGCGAFAKYALDVLLAQPLNRA